MKTNNVQICRLCKQLRRKHWIDEAEVKKRKTYKLIQLGSRKIDIQRCGLWCKKDLLHYDEYQEMTNFEVLKYLAKRKN